MPNNRKTLLELLQIDPNIPDNEVLSNLRMLLTASLDLHERQRKRCWKCYGTPKKCPVCEESFKVEHRILLWLDGVFKFID